jgi:hypothetical protein
MALDPHIFTTTTASRRRLRDYVIDLNQQKNFDQIVQHVRDVLKKSAGNRHAMLLVKAHSASELTRTIETNLKRLAIDFSDIPVESLDGASEDDFWNRVKDHDWMSPDELWEWWGDALGGDDDPDGNPDNILNVNERRQLDEIEEDL